MAPSAALLAPGATPRLPALDGIPLVLRRHAPETQADFARLAAPLVRAGVLTGADRARDDALPTELVGRGWARHSARSLARAGDGMEVHLTLRLWADLTELCEEPARPGDEACFAVLVEVDTCSVLSLGAVCRRWGEKAAAVVAAALRTGLGRVVHVFVPDDLDWVAAWWVECVESVEDDDEEERRLTLERVQEFQAAQEFVRDLSADLRGRAALLEGLRALPAGPVRRSAAGLLSTRRRARPLRRAAALDRIRSSEDGYDSAAVLLTQDADDAVRHAYDEMQEQSMNSGFGPPPHAVHLVDTRSPARLAASLRHLRRVLRTLALGQHLVRAIQDLL
ncbi:MAG: hypothetical protein JWM27_4885 [Gemmatimonadetes bacterium]|nr:hypothetical protein [Gemmatimonadota bacterium]